MSVTQEQQKALDRLKIKIMMMPNTVFYTTIMFSLKWVFDNDVPTAGVNAKELHINPTWFFTLSEDEQTGLLIHEILHIALGHLTRKGERNHQVWNYAGDFVINYALYESGYTLPPNGCHDLKFGDMSTEQVYDQLIKDHPPEELVAVYGDIMQDLPESTDSDDNAETEQAVADMVLRASMQSQAANEKPGSILGEILRNLEEVINPKLPWNIILQNYLQEYAPNDYSFKKPNRRYMPEFYFPSIWGESSCDLVIAVDSSGSVTDDEFSYFIAEISAIQEMLKPQKITIIDFDTEIKDIQIATLDTDILHDISFTGKGGTNITPILQWINDNTPMITIVFTDGYFRQPDIRIDTDTIWMIHDNENFTTNYGRVINYDID